MKIDTNKLKEEIELLLRRLQFARTLTEYKKLCVSVFNLIDIYTSLTKSDEEFGVPMNKYYEFLLKKNVFSPLNIHIDDYYLNMVKHQNLSKKVLSTYQKTGFIYYDMLGREQRLKEKEYLEIIRGFLNEYDPKIDKLFLDMKDKEIDLYSTKYFETDSTYDIPSLDKSYILVENDLSVEGMSTMIHELAHAYINKIFRTLSFKQAFNSDVTYYTEIFSMFLENIFTEYLIRNKITVIDAHISMNNFYEWINRNFKTLEDINGLSKEETLEEEKETIDEALLYGYSGMIALELTERYNKDNSGVKKDVMRFITTSGILISDELIHSLGIDMKDVASCKTLKKRLITHNKDMKTITNSGNI